jgi:arylsulfatase A-like enzyme
VPWLAIETSPEFAMNACCLRAAAALCVVLCSCEQPSSVVPVSRAPAAVAAVANELKIDLVANRLRFHRYDNGLHISFHDQSFRKYDNEYSSPWRIESDGAHIAGGEATLNIPWTGGSMKVTVVTTSTSKVKIAVDGKSIDANSNQVAAGEHVLRIRADRKVAITEVIVSNGATISAALPCVDNASSSQLPVANVLEILQEIPVNAVLRFEPAGAANATGSIEVETEGAAPTTIWSGRSGTGEQSISLAAFGNKLVRLRLVSSFCALRWNNAVIAVPTAAPQALPKFDNVLLVVVDTLRADRLAIYGKTRIATPRITAAAAHNGVVMLRNQSMAPSSPPSHATIQTGQIPRVHGAAGDKGDIKPNTPVLSAIAHDAGFWTGYVGNNDFAMARFRKVGKWNEFHTPTREKEGVDCTAVVRRALAMVETAKASKQRFFISMLPVEPHVPYRFHKGITEKYFAGPFDAPFGREVTGEHLDNFKNLKLGPHSMDQLRGLHDGEVEYFDGCFAALQDGLTKLGVADKTAVILTSDHGEGLGERGGRVGHAYSLNHELVTVPWVIFAPGVSPAVVHEVSSNADIAPTVLALLGLPADERMQGLSVVPTVLTAGAALPRVVASEYGKALALRGGDWHYVVDYDGTGKLFNIVDNQQETRDLCSTHPMWLRYMREAMGWYLAQRTSWRAASWGALNDFAPSNPLQGKRK